MGTITTTCPGSLGAWVLIPSPHGKSYFNQQQQHCGEATGKRANCMQHFLPSRGLFNLRKITLRYDGLSLYYCFNLNILSGIDSITFIKTKVGNLAAFACLIKVCDEGCRQQCLVAGYIRCSLKSRGVINKKRHSTTHLMIFLLHT